MLYSYTLTKYFGLYKETKLTRKSLLIRRFNKPKKIIYCRDVLRSRSIISL